MFRQIPGHARAQTIPLALILGTYAYWRTDIIWIALGLLIQPVADFLWSQATHLHQENHDGKPPTWLERLQQGRRQSRRNEFIFAAIGTLVAVWGFELMVPFFRKY